MWAYVRIIHSAALTPSQSVHKVLEREFRPVEIQVEIGTDEERWALRFVSALLSLAGADERIEHSLVNMISGLQSLMELGCIVSSGMAFVLVFPFTHTLARNACIWYCARSARSGNHSGHLLETLSRHDDPNFNIQDEIIRQPIPPVDAGATSAAAKRPSDSMHTTPKSKKTRQEPTSQSTITSFFPVSPTNTVGKDDQPQSPMSATFLPVPPLQSYQSHPGYTLHLIDTKSRKTQSLPDDVDTKSSRLQLMLYHRLLSTLISNDFDFESLWKRLNLNPQMQFSARFQAQSGLIFASDDSRMNCLDGLVQLWSSNARLLNIDGIDRTLVLVYRIQHNTKHGKKKQKWAATRGHTDNLVGSLASKEDSDVARAIAESMKDITGPSSEDAGTKIDPELAAAIAESLKEHAQAGPALEGGSGGLGVLTGGTTSPDGTVSVEVAEEPELLRVLQQSLVHQFQKGMSRQLPRCQ